MELGPVKNLPAQKVIRLEAKVTDTTPDGTVRLSEPILDVLCVVEVLDPIVISCTDGPTRTELITTRRGVWITIPICDFWQLGRDSAIPLKVLHKSDLGNTTIDLENLQNWERSDIRMQVDEDERLLTESYQPKKCDPPVVPPTKPSKQCDCEEEYLSPEKIKCAPTCDQCKHKSSCHYGLPALPEKKKCGCEAGPCKECSKEFNYPLGPAFDGSTLSTSHRPYVCPVCSGAGTVSRPPHIPGDQTTWSGTGTPMYTCHACQGTGVVWG